MTRVILFHQHDPGMIHVGGIGTFINTFIKHAPQDIEVDMVGVSSDPAKRPVGRWHELEVGGRRCRFLPVVAAHPGYRGRVPVSVHFSWALGRMRHLLDLRNAVLDLHRVEPIVPLKHLPNPKVLVLHAHSMDIYNPHTEVIWKRVPKLYFWLERTLIRHMDQVFIVREDAVAWAKQQYPFMAGRIDFLPTWVDEETFASLPEPQRVEARRRLAAQHGVDPAKRLLLFVGRYEGQKDPLMLLESMRQLNGLSASTQLVMIGEGSMEAQMRGFIAQHQLDAQVKILGPQPQTEIAQWMNAADSLVLSSAFEGMPRVVVESLSCGLPVITTAVGEAPRLLGDPRAGALVHERTPQAFSAAVREALTRAPDRAVCRQQIEPFTANKILSKVYAAYRELAARRGTA